MRGEAEYSEDGKHDVENDFGVNKALLTVLNCLDIARACCLYPYSADIY